MRINTQFPVAIHILAVLAFFKDENYTSSDLARSVGTNPVVIRRLISQLKSAGLVDARSGVKGISLCKKPEEISLLEVYKALRLPEEVVFDLHPNPNSQCEVGAHILAAVNGPFLSAQKAMEDELASFYLSDVLESINAGLRKCPGLGRNF